MNTMFFTNNKKKHEYPIPSNKNNITLLTRPYMLRPVNRTGLIRDFNTDNVAPVTIQPPKTMKWGEPTWFLFHTIAEKIKDENFLIMRKELLNIIYTICVNLPCPDCASHATTYMNGINFNIIQNKTQLKDMLFTFHNVVNARKNFQLFNRLELDEKYSKAVTVNILKNFMTHFENKTQNAHMMANNLHRMNAVVSVKNWFNRNYIMFDP